MRTVTISGRLGANAEVKTTKKGTQYLSFRMASKEYGDAEPIWVNVSSFNPGDINRAKWFTQGKPVNVIGNFKPTAYLSRQNVNTAGLDITAFSVEWVNNGQAENEESAGQTKTTQEYRTRKETAKVESQPEMVVTNSGPANPYTAPQQTSQDVDGDLPF